MLDINIPDTHETKALDQSNFAKIQPETGISVEQSQHYWEQLPSRNEAFTSELKNEGNASDGLDYTGHEKVENKPIYIITKNESLENDVHPVTGVPFERKIIDLPSGEKIEGVFPKFESTCDVKIPEELYTSNDVKQFKECNKQLYEKIESSKELRGLFTEEQIEQIKDGIKDGTAPDGYVWHHDAEAGKIQLVNAEIHAKTGHTGGRAVWGGGDKYR